MHGSGQADHVQGEGSSWVCACLPPKGVAYGQEPLIASLLLVAMPGAPSSVLAPSSDARSP